MADNAILDAMRDIGYTLPANVSDILPIIDHGSWDVAIQHVRSILDVQGFLAYTSDERIGEFDDVGHKRAAYACWDFIRAASDNQCKVFPPLLRTAELDICPHRMQIRFMPVHAPDVIVRRISLPDDATIQDVLVAHDSEANTALSTIDLDRLSIDRKFVVDVRICGE